MVATVGSISVDLAVKSASFEAGFKRAATTVERESGRMSKATATAERSMSSLSTVATRFGAGLAGVLGTREVIQYADAWTEAGNKIRSASEVAGVQARGLRELNDIATETRTGITETVSLYSKLLTATEDVAKSEKEVALATEIVNKAFKAGGAAASEQAAGILQLGQALASGVLQGDELRSLRENAPLIAQAIATEFNTTIGGLKALGEQGVLTSDRVFKALLKGQGDIEAAFDKTEATIGDGFTRIGNAGTELIGTLSEVTGGAGSLTGELSQFASEMEKLSNGIKRFADDPSIRSFLHDVLGGATFEEGSIADKFAVEFTEVEQVVKNSIANIQAEIAKLEAEKEEGGILAGIIGRNNDAEILKLTQRLAELREELRQVEIQSHTALAPLARSAEDASMRALAAIRAVESEILSIPDKTVTITVRTVEVPGGSVNVSSHTVDPATYALTNPIRNQVKVDDTGLGTGLTGGGVTTTTRTRYLDPLGNYSTFATGGFTGNGPDDRVAGLVHGGEFVFDAETTRRLGAKNLEAITRGVRGYQAGGSVGPAPGGRDTLGMIEENTFRTAEEVVRVVGYLQTLVDDGQTALAALRNIETGIGMVVVAIGGVASAIGSISISAGGGGTSGGGGTAGSSGGGGSTSGTADVIGEGLKTGYYRGQEYQYYDYHDPKAPYTYSKNPSTPIGSGGYDPLADFMLNGNYGALDALLKSEARQGALASGTSTFVEDLLRQGPSMGTYGDTGVNVSSDTSKFRFFASGGMIHPGDSQPVSFFKSPDEAVGVFRPEQMRAIGDAMSGITVHSHYHAAPGNPDPSPRAMMEQQDRLRRTVRQVAGGL